MTKSRRRASAALLGVFACLLTLSACTGSPAPHTSASAPARSPTLGTPAPAPAVGSCHRLGFDAAAQAIDTSPQVPCRGTHTAITYYVGSYNPVQDGHLLTIGAGAIQAQLAQRCPARLGKYLGGGREALRLSRLESVWFGPTPAQTRTGAHWFRCDVIAPADGRRLESLPRSLRGALTGNGLDLWGTCGTTSPSGATFQQVACRDKHTWRAIRTVDIAGSRYLAKSATEVGNTTCKDAASARANGALKYTWSFQWPSRAHWSSGQRYGYCWIPDAG